MSDIEKELIENKYALAEWIGDKAAYIAMKRLEQTVLKVDGRFKKVAEQQKRLNDSINAISSYVKSIKDYEENLNKKEKALSDKKGNLQNIYNKMIQIEKRLNSGECPGVLPPLDLDLSDDEGEG